MGELLYIARQEVVNTVVQCFSFQISQMNKSSSMRNYVAVAALLFGSILIAPAALAAPVKVVKVDPNSHTFTVQYSAPWHSRHGMSSHTVSHETTYKTTDKTTYWVGNTKGSWADVTKGANVNVTAHTEGSSKVADKVQIVSAS